MRRPPLLLGAVALAAVGHVTLAHAAPAPSITPLSPARALVPILVANAYSAQRRVAAGVAAANASARVQPTRSDYLGAIQVFPFDDGSLYQVYAAPGEVTDIALEAGETLAGSGPVAAGDTVRWIIGQAESGTGPASRVHILLKPTAANLATNLVVNTDRRTYHLELRSTARAYMAEVSWRYPQDELIALRQAESARLAATPAASGVEVTKLRFRYRIEGDRPTWRPLQAFDDGSRVYIAMPASLPQGEAPPLFVVGADGKSEIVNYRVSDGWYVVDRLFDRAELRLGDKHQQVVRIVRSDLPAGRAKNHKDKGSVS